MGDILPWVSLISVIAGVFGFFIRLDSRLGRLNENLERLAAQSTKEHGDLLREVSETRREMANEHKEMIQTSAAERELLIAISERLGAHVEEERNARGRT